MAQILGSKGGLMEYEEPRKSEIKRLLDLSLEGAAYPEDPLLFEAAAVGRIRRFIEGSLPWEDLHQFFVRNAKLRQVSLDITNRCNLQCEHCFYTADSDKVTSLDLPQWQAILEQIYQHGVKTVTIAGKEPFISRQSVDVLRRLDALKQRDRHPFHYGVVTNGTLLHRFVEELAPLDMDYLDVSIDGLRETHDRFRGRGTFNKSLRNLKLAVEQQVARKIFVASVLHEQNGAELVDMIDFFSDQGISHFIVGLFFPTPYTPPSLVLADETLIGFIESVNDWAAKRRADRPIEVVIDYNSTVLCYLPLLFERGILSYEKTYLDQSGNFYAKASYDSGVDVFIEFPPFMEFSYWGVARIKDGQYIGGCEPLTREGDGWRHFAVGNVLEEPLGDIYRRSLEVQFGELVKDMEECRGNGRESFFRYTLGGDHLYTRVTNGGGVDYVWQQKQAA